MPIAYVCKRDAHVNMNHRKASRHCKTTETIFLACRTSMHYVGETGFEPRAIRLHRNLQQTELPLTDTLIALVVEELLHRAPIISTKHLVYGLEVHTHHLVVNEIYRVDDIW